MSKERLDIILVDRGLVESREKAKALIMAGEVSVNEQVILKASATFSLDVQVKVKTPPKYVGRGGFKLEHALKHFFIDVKGMRALDIGASTGGFTDCLLQQGAEHVAALDVGHAQLNWKIRNDPRVKVVEGVNARTLEPNFFGELFDLVVMDVSFISQRLIWPRIVEQLKKGGSTIALIKPQFEVQRQEVDKGGVVKNPGLHQRVIREIHDFVEQEVGFVVKGVTPSPILGKEGNQEFLICAQLLKK